MKCLIIQLASLSFLQPFQTFEFCHGWNQNAQKPSYLASTGSWDCCWLGILGLLMFFVQHLKNQFAYQKTILLMNMVISHDIIRETISMKKKIWPCYWSSCAEQWHCGWVTIDIWPTSYHLFLLHKRENICPLSMADRSTSLNSKKPSIPYIFFLLLELPAKALINSLTLRLGSRLNTSYNFDIQ